jgi:hypothetical protein
MGRDINAIILMLTSQGMINLGEMPDPVTKQTNIKPGGAKIFIDLLEVLEQKTRGNLSTDEEKFLENALNNLKRIYHEKFSIGN